MNSIQILPWRRLDQNKSYHNVIDVNCLEERSSRDLTAARPINQIFVVAETLLFVFAAVRTNAAKLRLDISNPASTLFWLGAVLLTTPNLTWGFSCSGQPDCAQPKAAIVNSSGIKLLSPEKKAVRRAAENFLRMEVNALLDADHYENIDAFEAVAKKYMTIPVERWNTKSRESTDFLVCDALDFLGLQTISENEYVVEYRLKSAAKRDIRATKNGVAETFYSDAVGLIGKRYWLTFVENSWKVYRTESTPAGRVFYLRKALYGLSRAAQRGSDTPENIAHAREIYRQMTTAQQNICLHPKRK